MKHALTCLIAILLLAPAALGQNSTVEIRSTESLDTRIPIVVPPVITDDPSLAAVAEQMHNALVGDLSFSGLFRILPRERYPRGFEGLDPDASRVDLDAWGPTGAESLVYAKVLRQEGNLVTQFRLFDLLSKDQVMGKQIGGSEARARLMAHTFSEELIRQIEGTPGIGTTQICFAGGASGNKEIYIADYDGANMRQLTEHNSISINPQFSPDGTKIAYMSFKDRYAFLYILDRESGRVTPLSKEVGLNSSPAWSPDGNTIALTLSKDGNSEIYLRNPDGSNPRRLTNNKHNDTSPTFSPDGNYIAWVADIGSPQIYVMNPDGTGARRVSYQGGGSYDPVWSPDGTQIAYSANKRGDGLEIYTVNVRTGQTRRLTDSHGANEAPSWSPDSRHIAFTSTRSGKAEIWFVNLETGHEQPMAGGTIRRESPSWGPRRR